jgi:hypothetical protein
MLLSRRWLLWLQSFQLSPRLFWLKMRGAIAQHLRHLLPPYSSTLSYCLIELWQKNNFVFLFQTVEF